MLCQFEEGRQTAVEWEEIAHFLRSSLEQAGTAGLRR
jgi:hypothetical protein